MPPKHTPINDARTWVQHCSMGIMRHDSFSEANLIQRDTEMRYPDTFEGYAVKSKENWSDFYCMRYKPKRLDDYDIGIEIIHCSICASDWHTIKVSCNETDYPVVAGHEIAGEARKVCPKVKSIKESDRVSVEGQVSTCLECRMVHSNPMFPDGSAKTIMTTIVLIKWIRKRLLLLV